MKVLHLPTTVGGNPQGISRHLNKIGIHSDSWTLRKNYFDYQTDKTIISEKDSWIAAEFKKLLALHYIFNYDVIFYNFGCTLFTPTIYMGKKRKNLFRRTLSTIYNFYESFMQRVELFALKLMKRTVLVQYQGDDARQGDYCITNFDISIATQVGSTYYNSSSDDIKRKQITLLDKYCHKIYALNPDLLHVLPKRAEFLPYSHISLEEWSPVYSQLENRPLRIGHAPSHQGAKGTKLIVETVENLHYLGYKFEFIIVEGLSYHKARKLYKSFDILVDQLFAGWYGGLAVECMALGKPVLAYIREDDLIYIPEPMRRELPIINTRPQDIKKVLQRVLETPRNELFELAKRSREYVEKWHNPITIAKRIKCDVDLANSLPH